MKLKGIIQSGGSNNELILETDPPITEEIYNKFQELWPHEETYFDPENGKLVWCGSSVPDRMFVSQANIYLTEAENALAQEKGGINDYRQQRLKKASEASGLPLI